MELRAETKTTLVLRAPLSWAMTQGLAVGTEGSGWSDLHYKKFCGFNT